MNDEIKEILDNLIRYRYSDYKCKQPEDCLTIEDVWLLLDYITNLQEENKRLKELCDKYEEEHNTTFKLWKGKLKETMDETLIQKQHDRTKELEAINEEHRKLNGELREENEGLKGAIETIKETNKLLIQQKAQLQDDLDMLDKRNEKAVDLIIGKIDYDDEYPGYMQMLEVDYNDLLNILQGK